MARGHAEALAPMVDVVMREAALGMGAIDRLAVTIGPGTFTGTRVGLAFMRGLALAIGRPLAGVASLDAMAAEALAHESAPLAAAIVDARRGEVYLGARGAGGETRLAPALLSFDRALDVLAAMTVSPVALAGSAAEAMSAALAARGVAATDSGVRNPDAVFVARLGVDAPAGETPPRPLYLRAPDAKLPAARP